jgi:hypothetical protein
MASSGTVNCSFRTDFATTRSVIRSIILPGIVLAAACSGEQTRETGPEPCSEQWQHFVEARLHTGDSQGHGPDVGSAEWYSVVEFKLGIRGNPEVPSRESLEWCTYIDDRIGELGG